MSTDNLVTLSSVAEILERYVDLLRDKVKYRDQVLRGLLLEEVPALLVRIYRTIEVDRATDPGTPGPAKPHSKHENSAK